MSVHQPLAAADQQSRALYSGWFPRSCDDNVDLMHKIWFSDETHCHPDGRLNFQNLRCWTTEPPGLITGAPVYSTARFKWAARALWGLYGPMATLGRLGPSTPDGTGWRWEVLGRALHGAKFWDPLHPTPFGRFHINPYLDFSVEIPHIHPYPFLGRKFPVSTDIPASTLKNLWFYALCINKPLFHTVRKA